MEVVGRGGGGRPSTGAAGQARSRRTATTPQHRRRRDYRCHSRRQDRRVCREHGLSRPPPPPPLPLPPPRETTRAMLPQPPTRWWPIPRGRSYTGLLDRRNPRNRKPRKRTAPMLVASRCEPRARRVPETPRTRHGKATPRRQGRCGRGMAVIPLSGGCPLDLSTSLKRARAAAAAAGWGTGAGTRG